MTAKIVPITGPGSRAVVNRYLMDHHYLGPLPAWKTALVALSVDGRWQGVVVLGSPCSPAYGETYLEVRRIAVSWGVQRRDIADDLVAAAQSWAKAHSFAHVLAYADPNVSSAIDCPGNRDTTLWTDAGFAGAGSTRSRKSTEKGSNRRVMDGSRARFLWEVPA